MLDFGSDAVTRLDPKLNDRVFCVAFSPDGRHLGFGQDASVVAWDLEKKQEQFEVAAPWTRAIAFAPDGNVLATAGQNGVQFWNAQTGAPREGLPAPDEAVSLAYSPMDGCWPSAIGRETFRSGTWRADVVSGLPT